MGDAREALAALLDAIMECGSYVDLDGAAERDGPVVRAYGALGKPLPAEVRNWLQIGTGERGADA